MKCYDIGDKNKFVMYLDPNSLYGRVMSQYLPCSEFKWLKQREIDGFCFNSIEENSSLDYMSQADLDYLDELHTLHNDYPLN